MSKRRAEDTLLLDSPSKRCCRALYTVDMGSVVPAGGMNPPSLLALLGSRSRKRPYYFENPEEQEDGEAFGYRKATTHHSDTRKHAVNVLTLQTSGNFQDRRSFSALTSSKKEREDSFSSETAPPEVADAADGDTNTEDSVYNSFQYWRAPLPKLDLSLLEDANDHPQAKDTPKVNDSSSDAMET